MEGEQDILALGYLTVDVPHGDGLRLVALLTTHTSGGSIWECAVWTSGPKQPPMDTPHWTDPLLEHWTMTTANSSTLFCDSASRDSLGLLPLPLPLANASESVNRQRRRRGSISTVIGRVRVMVFLLGVPLPDRKAVHVALAHIHGIGRPTAIAITHKLGIHPHARMASLDDAALTKLAQALNAVPTDAECRRTVQSNISALVNTGATRGIRMRLSLPVRGQRTSSNARTAHKYNRGRVSASAGSQSVTPAARPFSKKAQTRAFSSWAHSSSFSDCRFRI